MPEKSKRKDSELRAIIRRLKTVYGWESQAQVAEWLGISQGALANWITREAPKAKVEILAKLDGHPDTDYIMEGVDPNGLENEGLEEIHPTPRGILVTTFNAAKRRMIGCKSTAEQVEYISKVLAEALK